MLGCGERESDYPDSQIMALQQRFYNDKRFTKRTYAPTYIRSCLHAGMCRHVVYVFPHNVELSNVQLFHKVRSYQITFVWPVRGNGWPNGHDNDSSVKIAAPELTKKSVEVTNYIDESRDQETEEEMIRWWRRNRWQNLQRRGQWRPPKNRQFCMDWWWDWINAETTTSVTD